MRLLLEFAPEATLEYRGRLSYAFRLFCAIYGHQPLLHAEHADSADACIRYNSAFTSTSAASPRTVHLSNSYVPRLPTQPAPPPTPFAAHGEETVLVHGPGSGEQPDWLAEIFEWVSCADEYGVTDRDSLGRIRFPSTYAGRHHLDVRRPYAALAMWFLQRALCEQLPNAPAEPQSPINSVRHFVVPTHDVDFLPTGPFGSAFRLAKNGAISSILARNPKLGVQQARMAVEAATKQRNTLDQISHLVTRQRQLGVTASYYFLMRHLHRRDANYTIDQPGLVNIIRQLQTEGMEVGVHGSYRSLEKTDGLAEEYDCLRARGFRPVGGRQHWLRFTLDRLIPAVERAGAFYDASLGWAKRIGFPAGACFAFPPYNFEQERPATFIEIPTVIMDQALPEGLGGTADWYKEAAELLSASRCYGWGGISLLWHPCAFGGGWLSPEVGKVWWELLDKRDEWGDTWLSATDFVQAVRRRYSEAGLLPSAQEPAAPEPGQKAHQPKLVRA